MHKGSIMGTQQTQVIQFEIPAAMGAWHWNVDADRMVVSPSLAPFLSLDQEMQRSGISFDQFLAMIHQDDRVRVQHSVSKAIGDGSTFDEAYRVLSMDLGIRWVRAQGRCYYDADGAPVQMTGFAIEALPASGTLHAAILNRLIEARTLSIAANEGMLTKMIDAVMLEAGLQLAAAMQGLKDGRA